MTNTERIQANNAQLRECIETANALPDASGGYSDIPNYHFVESGRLVDKIREFKLAHPNNLVFGTVSDIHVFNGDATYEAKSKTSIKHAAFGLEMVGAMAECDFIANLGDNCWENGIDTENALIGAKYSINALKSAFNRVPCYNLVGNHDTSYSTQKIYDLIGIYNTFDTYATTRIRGFGYTDYSAKKVRVIVLNTCDYWNTKGGCGMSYEQKDFLMRALDLSAKSDYDEWQILLLSHIPLDWNNGDYNFYSDLQAILRAYNNGTSVSITVNSSYASAQNESSKYSGTLTYNYSGKNQPKVINIHGHVHTNKVSKIANTNIARVATPNTNPDLNRSESYPDYGDYSITTTEAEKIKKVQGTAKDTSATFYCIDIDKQVIYAVGYGADIDRTIPYKDAVVYSVTYNLTDVTSSNTSGTAVEGTSFTTTLSVGSGYAIDDVIVKMGNASVTSTSYDPNTGVVYIENVTGNIVITATAKDNYIPHWDIGDRTAVTNLYATATQTKQLSRNHYYYGVTGAGLFNYSKVTSCSLSGNDITFTCDERNYGIGIPYHLESGATYTFTAKASVTGRLRKIACNADGTFISESEKYSSSGTNLSLEFTAPTDTSQWVVLILDCYTANQAVTYSNVALAKK